jgi:hypothetical protein
MTDQDNTPARDSTETYEERRSARARAHDSLMINDAVAFYPQNEASKRYELNHAMQEEEIC